MPGHSASGVPQVQFLMRISRTGCELLKRSRTGCELSPDEKTLWIQSGLALSPLMGTCLQYSVDVCLAWALIGEWTSRVLFPVPKGPWPRHGHAGAFVQNYQCRSPRIVPWARAAFEQGALPSLLMMPGLAPVLSLPGDRMFQATEITAGHQRPAIMHAYGGAKVGMERSLSSIAAEGWIPMAAAMLGTEAKPPMWASIGLRPVAGTTIDFRVLPPFLSEREKLLLLSCWQQWDPTASYENGHLYEPRVTIAYFFTSHDHIHHVRVLWGTSPLLLFSDPRRTGWT